MSRRRARSAERNLQGAGPEALIEIFKAPTRFYKAGIAFLAWLNDAQSHFIMPAGFQSSREIAHYAEVFRLADQARLLSKPEIAEERKLDDPNIETYLMGMEVGASKKACMLDALTVRNHAASTSTLTPATAMASTATRAECLVGPWAPNRPSGKSD